MKSIRPYRTLTLATKLTGHGIPRLGLVLSSGFLLVSCASNSSFESLKNACEAFPRPVYQVKGKTKYDQTFVDRTTEAGVAGCNWKRPLKRPSSMDAQTVVVTPAVTPAPTVAVPLPQPAPPVVTVVPKKRHWWQRKPK